MSNIHEPNVHSTPSGSAWAWRDDSEFEGNPPLFETITWNGYSAEEGEYSAVLAKWSLNTKTQELHLEHVAIKYPYQPWDETLTNPARHVTDKHMRIAREVAREYFGFEKFKSRTRLYPQI